MAPGDDNHGPAATTASIGAAPSYARSVQRSQIVQEVVGWLDRYVGRVQ